MHFFPFLFFFLFFFMVTTVIIIAFLFEPRKKKQSASWCGKWVWIALSKTCANKRSKKIWIESPFLIFYLLLFFTLVACFGMQMRSWELYVSVYLLPPFNPSVEKKMSMFFRSIFTFSAILHAQYDVCLRMCDFHVRLE